MRVLNRMAAYFSSNWLIEKKSKKAREVHSSIELSILFRIDLCKDKLTMIAAEMSVRMEDND